MHELSVAHSLVELASEAAREGKAKAVKEVRLRIGALSCVAPEALEFCYEIATRDTLLEGSKLTYRRLPVIVHCASCARDVELPGIQSFRCPLCGSLSADIRQGRELEIEALEIEVDEAASADDSAAQIDPSIQSPTTAVETANLGTGGS